MPDQTMSPRTVSRRTMPAAALRRRLPGASLYAIGDRLRPRFDRAILRGSLLPDRPVQDTAALPWIGELERNWDRIRDEAVRALGGGAPALADISPDHGRIAADRRWKSLFLHGYGYRIARNCAEAPVAAAITGRVPGLVAAFFSVLEAGCHIPRHRGVTKAMLTCHLPLVVPRDRANCRMRLDGRDLRWREGEALLFDDTFEHEVWNDTPEDRVILLVQVRRPCRGVSRLLQAAFLEGVKRSRFVQDARRNLGA